MDTDTKKKRPTTPGVKFRWCRTVACQTKEVYLILTSITGGQVTLEWKDDLGWYESDIVSLPYGLHSGFLLIREQVHPSFLNPDSSSVLNERDYKIDPFFISPHKFGVELFLQSSRSSGLWRENPYLRDRYLSFHHFDTRLDRSKGEDQLVSPRKSSSCQELGKLNYWSGDESVGLKKSEPSKPLKECKWTSGGSDSDLTVCGTDKTNHVDGTKLKKWKSLGGEKSTHSRGDSLHSPCSRRRSFRIERIKKNEFSGSAQPNQKLSKSDGDAFGQHVKASKTLLFHADLHQLKLDVLARTQGIDSLLKHSDDEAEVEAGQSFQRSLYFKEINPPTTEGYGCLITFESRSTSMDDLGSPRALEDVLVSLTSTDTEPKHYHSLTGTKDKEIVTKETVNDTVNESRNQDLNKLLESYTEISTQSKPEEEISLDHSSISEKIFSKYPESDVTIHEDENFQYDSLKNDDHKIPLNIRDVLDSEDSLDFNVNLRSKSDYKQLDLLENIQIHKSESGSELKITKIFDHSEDSDYEERSDGVTGSYNFECREHPTSAQGEVATDTFVLIHPGSLRSETENESQKRLLERPNKPISNKPIFIGSSKAERSESKGKDSEKRTIVIIKDKRQPKMSTTGTQTSSRVLTSKYTQSSANRSLPTFAHKYKENINYSPLPNKVSGPWSTKYTNDKVTSKSYPYSENSQVKKLQNDLYNITKADKILKNIHPFDYRPTFVHKYKIQDTDSENDHAEKPQISTSISNSYKNINIPRPSFSGSRKSVKTAKNIAFKIHSNTSSLSSASSTNHKPSNNVYASHRASFPPRIYPTPLQMSYSTPKRVKIVPKPYFSIYGKDVSNASEDYFSKSNLDATNLPFMSSSLFRSMSSPVRPAKSLPDLRLGRERSSYIKRFQGRSSRAYSSPPVYKENDYHQGSSGNPCAVTPFIDSRRRKSCSLEDRFPFSGSSGESTDSLIEEANNLTYNPRRNISNEFRKGEIYTRVPTRTTSSYARRRTISSSDPVRDIVPLRNTALISSYVSESSFTGALRARSETDLRMVGKLAGGSQGEPPYLPYRNEHLTIGQIVKVLVPGEGVALARVVYNPIGKNSSHLNSYGKEKHITVVLLSEPTSLTGSVITVPLNKILLAWPKV